MAAKLTLMGVAAELQQVAPAIEASAALTLVDVAKEQAATSPNATNTLSTATKTLLDVARQEQASSTVASETGDTTANKSVLLDLAKQISREDSARIANSISATAQEVKAAQGELRAAALNDVVAQVAREEQVAVVALQANINNDKRIETSKALSTAALKPDPSGDDDGYSSFEDEENTADKANNQKKLSRARAQDEDSDVEEDAGDSGPQRTTPCDSKECKEFLRAVYHSDKTKIRDMLENGDVDANVADQVLFPSDIAVLGVGDTHERRLAFSPARLERIALGCLAGALGCPLLAPRQGGEREPGRSRKVTLAAACSLAHTALPVQMNGWSPLHVAVVREAVSCVKLLLDAGADPSISDHYGDTVVTIARGLRGKKRLKLLELLQEARAQHGNQP